jgi:acetyltransferase
VVRNIQTSGFGGLIGVVSPNYAEIGGLAAVATLTDLAFVPDLIVVTAPADAVLGIVETAGDLGVAVAVVISSGLGRGDGSITADLEASARRFRMRLVGPNSLGIIAPYANLNASFAAGTPLPGALALISQSGAVAAGTVGWAAQRGVGFSAVVSIGDQVDVDIADLLDHFAMDRRTRAILLYVEDIKDAR